MPRPTDGQLRDFASKEHAIHLWQVDAALELIAARKALATIKAWTDRHIDSQGTSDMVATLMSRWVDVRQAVLDYDATLKETP